MTVEVVGSEIMYDKGVHSRASEVDNILQAIEARTIQLDNVDELVLAALMAQSVQLDRINALLETLVVNAVSLSR